MENNQNEIIQLISTSGVSEVKTKSIVDSLSRFFQKIEEWKSQVETIKVTSPDQTDLMAWIDLFVCPDLPGGKYTKKSQAKSDAIRQKFEAFKIWAKQEIQKS